MIICSSCDSAQMLQITESSIRFEGNPREVVLVKERYHCTLCNNRGEYRYKDGSKPRITGNIEQTADKPRVGP